MDYDQILSACSIVANAQNHPKPKISQAEAYLESFKKLSNPYKLCFKILDETQLQKDPNHQNIVILAQFISITALREAILREWSDLEKSNQIEEIAGYCFKILKEIKNINQNQLARLLAIMAKRQQALQNTEKLLKTLYESSIEILQTNGNNSDNHNIKISSIILESLLTEYLAADNSSNISLSWEKHFTCKKEFQNNKLLNIFELVLAFLGHHYTEHFANLLLTILSWNFVPKIKSRRAAMTQKDSEYIAFKPTSSWRSILLNDQTLQSIFDICKNHPNHTTYSILQQLCSCQGVAIFGESSMKNEEVPPRVKYVEFCLRYFTSSFGNDFFQYLSQNLSSNMERGPHCFGLALAIGNLVQVNCSWVLKLAAENEGSRNFYPWLLEVSRFIIIHASEDALEDYDTRSENKLEAAYSEIIKAWYYLVEDDRRHPINSEILHNLFEILIKSFLCKNYGYRNLISNSTENQQEIDLENESLEDENDDRIIFDMHFSTISRILRGTCWKKDYFCLQMLKEICISKFADLKKNLSSGHQENLNLDDIFEEIHFLIIICGYFFADYADGESLVIPIEFELVKSNRCPHFFNLIEEIFGFLKFITEFIESNTNNPINQYLISPMILEDLCWFMNRFGSTYWLFWEEGVNEKTSVDIKQAFSMTRNNNPEKGNVSTYINFLTNGVFKIFQISIQHFSSETNLVKQAACMVTNLTKNRPYRSHLLEPMLRELANDFSRNVEKIGIVASKNSASRNNKSQQIKLKTQSFWTSQLSPAATRLVVQCLLQISFTDLQTVNLYWENNQNSGAPVFQTLQIFFQNFPEKLLNLSSENLNDCFYKYGIVDMTIGTAQSVATDNVNMIFQLLTPFLRFSSNYISMLSSYKETVNLILELINILVYNTSGLMNLDQTKFVNEVILKALQAFTNNKMGEQSQWTQGRDLEEENFQDLILIMDILDNLMNSGFTDLDDCDGPLPGLGDGVNSNETNVAITDSCGATLIYGLCLILPVMNEELLTLPALSNRYYKLCTLLCEIYPEKVLSLSGNHLQSFDYTLQLAINSGPLTACQALDAITELSTNVYDSPRKNRTLHNNQDILNFLDHMIKPVFTASILYCNRTEEMGGSCSRSFYELFKSHNTISQKCLRYLESIVNDVHDDNYRQQVQSLISDLVKLMIEFIGNSSQIENRALKRKNRNAFVKVYDEVLSKVGPLILVK